MRVVVPPVLARKADDAFTLERGFGFRCHSHCTLVRTFAGKQAVVWIEIQLTGMVAPYSREISVGVNISFSSLSHLHSRVILRGPVMMQLTVFPFIISEEARHTGPRIYRSSNRCSPAPPTSSSTIKDDAANRTVRWCSTPI